eukprot:TRINITY_DN37525_c0_g1_i1.p4 TRINITY_DN37525_c0_g1~~TRINITY_DN37525_c0_g1_i1.p4  ORF type:complete len:160 (+),score=17.60 TRINITY_DN37525_c0_g1_i1:157-636(+)
MLKWRQAFIVAAAIGHAIASTPSRTLDGPATRGPAFGYATMGGNVANSGSTTSGKPWCAGDVTACLGHLREAFVYSRGRPMTFGFPKTQEVLTSTHGCSKKEGPKTGKQRRKIGVGGKEGEISKKVGGGRMKTEDGSTDATTKLLLVKAKKRQAHPKQN